MTKPTFPNPGVLADALRSGKWRKARSQLGRSRNYRCCLGVGSELALGRELTDGEGEYYLPRYIGVHQGWLDGHWGALTGLNDTEASWNPVIKYLDNLQAEMDKEADHG